MRLNKVMKNLAIVVPLMTLAACGSTSKIEEDTQATTNAEIQAQQEAAKAEETVRVNAAKAAQKFGLKKNHILMLAVG